MQTEQKKSLGLKIRLARMGAGLSLDKLTAKSGVPRSTLSRIESSNRAIKLADFLAICTALRIHPITLICDSEAWAPDRVSL